MVRPSNLRHERLVLRRDAFDWRCLLHVVHARNGGISLRVLSEANETEATTATGVAILDDDLRMLVKVAWGGMKVTYSFLDLAELFKLLAKNGIVGVPGEASVVAC